MDVPRDQRTGVAHREKWAAFDPHDPSCVAQWDVVERIRDRVVADARFAAGQRVLDIGAGAGLLALEARAPLGTAGYVVALDLSLGALRACRRRALAGPDGGAALLPVAGDALALPLRDETFDVLVARSVFMYLDDRAQAARECSRVLRPGGRVALFEPITRRRTWRRWYDGFDAPAFRPEHGRIMARLRRQEERDADWAAMRDFDERDLVGHFVAAGFAEVALEYRYRATNRHETEVLAGSDALASTPGYAEAAREVLGPAATAYLARLGAATVCHRPSGSSGSSAEAYLTATR